MNRAVSVAFVACFALSASAAPSRSHIARADRTTTATPGTVCNDTPKLGYSNGPLIQHVKVVDVFYSPGNQYKAMLEDYYKAILQSAFFDWLVEYNAGSYKISRGTFVTSFEDSNVNPTTVKQVDPETYLKGLLAQAGKLPAPDDDTMYMLYFPSGIDPTDGSGPSCISNGDYCAYHSSYQATGGQMVRYGVIPDMDAGSCNQGCGPAGFPSFTDVSSHELVEAVTDPDGSGWYDTGAPDSSPNNCGEIGDICAVGGTQETGTIGGFIVQKEWSNKNNACIVTDPNAVLNDFTIAAAPSEVEVPVGGSTTATVTLTKKSGMAESVALTSPTPPTGLTAAFSPASVTSDAGTSTLTISASPTLSAGMTLMLTVKGTGSAVSETATVNVTIVAPADMATSSSGGGSGGSGGGNGAHGGGSAGGCSMSRFPVDGGTAGAALFALALVALAFRRRQA